MQSKVHLSTCSAGVRSVLALVLVACLVECATEQRINSRGSKPSNLIQKVNGWRSQRGGSCLSYGHSCWGAHGKRSGKPPASAPDWYLTRILRRIVANSELNRAKQLTGQNEDAIYGTEEDTATNRLMNESEEAPMEPSSTGLEAKPMLDDDILSKMKLWQIMRAASDVK